MFRRNRHKQGAGPSATTSDPVKQQIFNAMRSLTVENVPALEVGLYRTMWGEIRRLGMHAGDSERQAVQLAATLQAALVGTATSPDLPTLPEAETGDQVVRRYRRELIEGIHGLANPEGEVTLVTRIMAAAQGQLGENAGDPQVLATELSFYFLLALLTGPSRESPASEEIMLVKRGMAWLFTSGIADAIHEM